MKREQKPADTLGKVKELLNSELLPEMYELAKVAQLILDPKFIHVLTMPGEVYKKIDFTDLCSDFVRMECRKQLYPWSHLKNELTPSIDDVTCETYQIGFHFLNEENPYNAPDIFENEMTSYDMDYVNTHGSRTVSFFISEDGEKYYTDGVLPSYNFEPSLRLKYIRAKYNQLVILRDGISTIRKAITERVLAHIGGNTMLPGDVYAQWVATKTLAPIAHKQVRQVQNLQVEIWDALKEFSELFTKFVIFNHVQTLGSRLDDNRTFNLYENDEFIIQASYEMTGEMYIMGRERPYKSRDYIIKLKLYRKTNTHDPAFAINFGSRREERAPEIVTNDDGLYGPLALDICKKFMLIPNLHADQENGIIPTSTLLPNCQTILDLVPALTESTKQYIINHNLSDNHYHRLTP